MEVTITSGLKPSTVETIRDQLEFQRNFHPRWFAYHFPAIASRGTSVEYSEVESMTEREMGSVRQLLINQIIYHRKRIAGRKARAITFLGDNQPDSDDEWTIRLKDCELVDGAIG